MVLQLQARILAPWISAISINKLALSMAWLSKKNAALAAAESSTFFDVDPARYFFYPNIFRPIDISLSLKGSLFPASAGTAPAVDAAAADPGLSLKAPWDDGESEGEGSGSSAAGAGARISACPSASPPSPRARPPMARLSP